MTSDPESSPRQISLDSVAAQLQELRLARGEPSYAEIAGRIAQLRIARGVPEVRARVGRTTVYDAFRAGRKRLDLDLVLDIVRALEVTGPEVNRWRELCLEAMRAARASGATPTIDDEPIARQRLSRRFIIATVLAAVVINLLGRVVVDLLGLSLYLDMTGTAIAAVLLGPWWAALVGLGTNLSGVFSSGWVSLPFALVNVAGALVWGYGYHRFGMGRTFLRFFTLNLLVGLVCTVVATPILLAHGGFTEHSSSDVVRAVLGVIPSVPLAVLTTNLVLSLVDKMVSGYAALVARELTQARSPRD